MFQRTPLFLVPVFFILKHTNESNDHPLLLLRAGCGQMRDLRQHRIFFGQLRVKYLIGRKAETAQKQFQRVHARSLFAQLDRGDLSVTNCTFSESCCRVSPCASRFSRRILPIRSETGSCNSTTDRSPPSTIFYMK